MKLTLNMQNKKEKKKDENIEESEREKNGEDEADMLQNTNKTMSYMMPVMAFSISLVAPLGLALYWLMSNVLMIIERIFLNKIMKKEGEEN